MSLDLPSVVQGGVFDLGGLYAELEKFSDKRKPRGKRYSLALVIVLAVLAKLCGQDRPYGMAQWVSAREQGLTIALGGSAPSPAVPEHLPQGVAGGGEPEASAEGTESFCVA